MLCPMKRRQRVGVYAICTDDAGRFLLVRAARWLSVAGHWFLPGGGVQHGEEPISCLRREVAEETGLTVKAATLLGVQSDTGPIPDGVLLHTVRLIYRIDEWHGELRAEADGSSDDVRWVEAASIGSLPVMPYVVEALGRFG
jgi:8-oxo-dGTP diphosphatase